ncbi:MAG TPA: hypothetical protein VFV98_05360 [Vicinamibacterales bacterium]|nr:hypothetical protein [Vicinamibacterales bacterium]
MLLRLTAVAIVATVATLGATQTKPALRTTQGMTCAADLGVGIESKRRFCDVLIGKTAAESVLLRIPPHAGPATLSFDLHNRFDVPLVTQPAVDGYARHDAVVAVIRSSGGVLGRATVMKEYRNPNDLFDRIAGGGRPGGVKAIAPGPPDSWRFTIPAGVPAVGIVGGRLRVIKAATDEVYDTPGRPIAIVSNVRVEYAPVR